MYCNFIVSFFLLIIAMPLMAEKDEYKTRNKKILDEIVVTGTRKETDVHKLSSTVTVVNRKQIELFNNTSFLPLLTEMIPGLFVTSRGMMGYGVSDGSAGNINMRGMNGGNGRIMMLIDGHPQYMGLMGHPVADINQSVMVERIEILRGPSSVIYGSNAMGGVINVITRKTEYKKTTTDLKIGYGSYNTLQDEITLTVNRNRLNCILGGSYNSTDGHRHDMQFRQYSAFLKSGYKISDLWNVESSVAMTVFDASHPGTVTFPLFDAEQHISRGSASLSLCNNNGNGRISIFYNWGRHHINDGYNKEGNELPKDFRFNSADRMYGISIHKNIQMSEKNNLTFGFDLYGIGGKAWNEFVSGEKVGEKKELTDKKQYETGVYADFCRKMTDFMSFNVGMRIDRHSDVGSEFVPQTGLVFNLSENSDLKLSLGKGFRYPTIREMFMWGTANEKLHPERIMNYEIAFSKRCSTIPFTYNLNLFYLDGNNMITTVFSDGRMMNANTGEIKNIGTELSAEYRLSRLCTSCFNYSYIHMKHAVVSTPEHKLYARVEFLENKWFFSTGLQYVTGLFKSVAPEKKETFLLWNARGEYKIAEFLNVWINGENLFAKKYEINDGYPMPGATVTGGVKIKF